MAQQIKKKFIGPDQIDGSKIKLLQGQSIRGVNSQGQEVDLVKITSQDKVQVLGQEVALKSQLDQEALDRQSGDASTLASAQSYADQKVAALVNSAPAVLDTLKELADALGGDANFATTISGQIGAVDSKVTAEVSRAQSAESALDQKISQEILDRQAADSSLQSQIDALNGNFATDVELASAVSSLQSSISSEVSRAQGEEQRIEGLVTSEQAARVAADNSLQSQINSEISARIAADAALQVQFNNLDNTFVNNTELSAAVNDLQGQIDNLDGYAQDIRNDVDQEIADRQSADSALSSRISVLEAKGFAKGVVTMGTELAYIDLDRQYSMLLSVAIGRVMIHEDRDFTVSVVGGKTRLTFIGSLVNPSGAEAIESGDEIFYSGAF